MRKNETFFKVLTEKKTFSIQQTSRFRLETCKSYTLKVSRAAAERTKIKKNNKKIIYFSFIFISSFPSSTLVWFAFYFFAYQIKKYSRAK
jgi:hypothetical protein